MTLAWYETTIRPPTGRQPRTASRANVQGHVIGPSLAPTRVARARSLAPVVYRLWGEARVEIRWNEPPQRNSSALYTSWPLPCARSVASAWGEPPEWTYIAR